MADRKYNNNSYNDIFNTLFSVSKFPPVDIYENDKGYVITAELAGYDEDKINIFAEKHVLHIASDEHENAKENSDRKYLIKERSVKSFERSFTLPEDANEENITALSLLVSSFKVKYKCPLVWALKLDISPFK